MKSTGGSIPNLAQVGAAPLHGGTRPAFGFSAPFTAMAAWQQAALMAVIIIFTATLARIDLGVFARLFFMAAALAAAAFYIRRSPWQYVTLTFWFWTLTPLARRLIDYNAGFDPVNFVLATPNLLTLFMLKDVLTSRDLLRRREAFVGLLLIMPILYGLIVSFVQGDIVPGATAAADWVAPLSYYFYVIANLRYIHEAEAPFREFLSINGIVLISYGIVQYFAPLAWDVAWVLDARMTSIGIPEPYKLRIFSTLNSPGPLAIWLGTVLLLFLHFRTKVSPLLVPAGVILLLMTLVRSVAGTTVMGLLLACMIGRAGTVKVLGVALLMIVLVGTGVATVNSELFDSLAQRLETLNELDTDTSALEREALYRAAPALINANPLGMGIGALGRGAVVGDNGDLVSVDSGPVAIYLSLGWIAGSVYWAGIVLVLVQALLAARMTRSSAALALAVAAVSAATNLLFVNITGFAAATVWTCAAYAATLGIVTRERTPTVRKARLSSDGKLPNQASTL